MEEGKAPPFLFLAGGVFTLFLLYGYMQELLFSKGLKPYGFFITFVQFIVYSMLSTAEIKYRNIKLSRVNLKSYVVVALLTVGTMALSNASLSYLSYPVQVVFKSCKLIPVMIGGILIQGKRFSRLEFMSSGFLSLGLAMFTLADVSVHPHYSLMGLVLISLALCADAAIGNVQESLMKRYNVETPEMVQKSYQIGAGFNSLKFKRLLVLMLLSVQCSCFSSVSFVVS
eukprot:m.247612 g.247612  ORF g.247612 m.247612 type:complete len:228 (+) comp16128_c0_seq10:1518-2201(+)